MSGITLLVENHYLKQSSTFSTDSPQSRVFPYAHGMMKRDALFYGKKKT